MKIVQGATTGDWGDNRANIVVAVARWWGQHADDGSLQFDSYAVALLTSTENSPQAKALALGLP